FLVVELLGQRDRDARADADDIDVRNPRQAVEEELQLGGRQGQRVAAGDNDVADFGVGGDIVDHAAVVAADGVPPATDHGGALARAEAAVHGADVGGDDQGPVWITMGQAGDGRVLVFFERVLQLITGGVLGLER